MLESMQDFSVHPHKVQFITTIQNTENTPQNPPFRLTSASKVVINIPSP